jgi:hypothetical protein
VIFAGSGMPSCAHMQVSNTESPESLLKEACSLGATNQAVRGSVWMTLDSKDAKGRFPATVEAQAPDRVTIEVTNLIGSREALIQVNQGSYSVDIPDRETGKSRRADGVGAWGGIPLRWASELFLGRIPCPSREQQSSLGTPGGAPGRITVHMTNTGELLAETPVEKFVYRFRQYAGKPWPEALHWERMGEHLREHQGETVDFKFDSPDDKTGTPKKWEAKSSLGEVKLRWSDLQISK